MFFDHRYPDIADLKARSRSRIPKFISDYIEEGCNRDEGLRRNRTSLDKILLGGSLMRPAVRPALQQSIFGASFSAPFGIAPVGLQGLMWPRAPEILARAAAEHNIPFVLSTVSSSSLERIAEISEGKAWFQLYNPSDDAVRQDLLRRIAAAEYQVLFVTVDVPAFAFRPRDIRNGLAMPPRMTLRNILQILSRPKWLWHTMLAGKPRLETMQRYLPKGGQKYDFAEFMHKMVMGATDMEGLRPIRDHWKGRLVIKGVLCEEDIEAAVELGADAVVISNHGARQSDIGAAPINVLRRIAKNYRKRITICFDSGLSSGPDIARALACGADFTFLGRPFLYGVCALGARGAEHTIHSLKMQLQQVMEQLRCSTPTQLRQCLLSDTDD